MATRPSSEDNIAAHTYTCIAHSAIMIHVTRTMKPCTHVSICTYIYIQLLCEAFPTLPPLDRYALLTPHHYVLLHSTMLRYNYPPSHRVFRGWFSRSFDPQSHTQQLTITGSMSHGADNTLYKIEQRYPKVTPLAETGGGA